MWKLTAMRDLNAADPLPPLGEKLPPAAPPAPPQTKPTERIVEGPDGKLSTNFPENEQAHWPVCRVGTGRIASGPAELHNLPKPETEGFFVHDEEVVWVSSKQDAEALAADWIKRRQGAHTAALAAPYGYGPTAERLLADAARADFSELEKRAYAAAVASGNADGYAERLLALAKEKELARQRLLAWPGRNEKEERIKVVPLPSERPKLVVFDDVGEDSIAALAARGRPPEPARRVLAVGETAAIEELEDGHVVRSALGRYKYDEITGTVTRVA